MKISGCLPLDREAAADSRGAPGIGGQAALIDGTTADLLVPCRLTGSVLLRGIPYAKT